jgi:hypothetical protein
MTAMSDESPALQEPRFSDPQALPAALSERGYAVVAAPEVAALASCTVSDLQSLADTWVDLPPDLYLKDGGRYRKRRHACFVGHAHTLEPVAHRPHWQPLAYNALHGGMERWFEPMRADATANPAWQRLLCALGRVCAQASGATDHERPTAAPWYVEAHQFRIDTTDGIGRPTPEGAHRDGVDYVAVLLIDRHGIKGGETRVFEANGPRGERFTMTQPWTLLLLDDAKVIHESTPIQPLVSGGQGWRDTLVLTYRRFGFQGA